MLFALVLCPVFVPDAVAQTDSLYYHLDSATFVSHRNTSVMKEGFGKTVSVSIRKMQKLPKLIGNNDPVNFIRLLPGVQTNSENDGGVHIHGCDNSHNQMSLGGVPVYGANHLLGLFSIFNPMHYQSMDYSGNAQSNRLGGMLNMKLPEPISEKITGEVNPGMMYIRGSLGFRINKKSSLRVSARQSYLDLLYKPWMKIDGSPFSYGFGDCNLTYMYSSAKDRIWADLYFGKDAVGVADKSLGFGISVDWGNAIGAIHWAHESATARHKHSIYYSGYASGGSISQGEQETAVNSGISSVGYMGDVQFQNFKVGADVTFHNVFPQSLSKSFSDRERQRALESSVSGSYENRFFGCLDVYAGLKASFYRSSDKYFFWGLSPKLTLSYDMFNFGKLSAEYGWKHQYLFQTGLTNIGFPLEFWLLSGRYTRPQYCQYAELSYTTSLFDNAFSLNVDIYGKRLYNQVEYKGDVLDLFLSEYDLEASLLKGKGWNYGMNIKLHKQSGNLTGWVSYSLGRALRSFNNPDYPDIYPANHERIHELNMVCIYELGRWNFSGTFVYAGGQPFTAPEAFYLSSGKIITLYGEHNAERMRPYIRLDLSVGYAFKERKGRKSGVDFALYNVLARENEVMYRLYVNKEGFSYDILAFPLKLVPSLCYYYRF